MVSSHAGLPASKGVASELCGGNRIPYNICWDEFWQFDFNNAIQNSDNISSELFQTQLSPP